MVDATRPHPAQALHGKDLLSSDPIEPECGAGLDVFGSEFGLRKFARTHDLRSTLKGIACVKSRMTKKSRLVPGDLSQIKSNQK